LKNGLLLAAVPDLAKNKEATAEAVTPHTMKHYIFKINLLK